jgi:hypothetical protein
MMLELLGVQYLNTYLIVVLKAMVSNRTLTSSRSSTINEEARLRKKGGNEIWKVMSA